MPQDAEQSLGELRRRYAGHATTADSLREELDVTLGDRTLTGELVALRGA